MMRALAIRAIRLYQAHLSPMKGYGCAYRIHVGRCGCSELGLRAIRRFGLLRGLQVLRKRMDLCGVAHRRFSPILQGSPHLQRQGGFVDLDCGAGPDIGCADGAGCGDGIGALDVLSCCDAGSCDFPDGGRKNRERERHIYIPPNSMRKSASSSL